MISMVSNHCTKVYEGDVEAVPVSRRFLGEDNLIY